MEEKETIIKIEKANEAFKSIIINKELDQAKVIEKEQREEAVYYLNFHINCNLIEIGGSRNF